MDAVECGHLEIVELLINKGANLYLRTYYNASPLENAIRRTNIAMFELLINKGACQYYGPSEWANVENEIGSRMIFGGECRLISLELLKIIKRYRGQ